jgi:hypothetical protein
VKPFKICSKCDYEWQTRDDFLQDASLFLIGLQAGYGKFDRGFYLFNHLAEKDKCNSTIAVGVENFMSLYSGPMYETVHAGSEACSGHCAKVDDLARCSVSCRNATAREVMLKVFNLKT